MNAQGENKLMRRVAGHHNYRLDGVGDILTRARDASVLDIGCSRGQVGHDFVLNGATVLHGCDIDPASIECARQWYADFRAVESRFEVVDLTKGPSGLVVFRRTYDIVLMLATVHKLKRIMSEGDLARLVTAIGRMAGKWFIWRATSEKANENELELRFMDRWLDDAGLRRVQTSYLSLQLGVAAIWARP